MPLIITPRQLALRAEFYHQIGALLSAGLPIINSLETVRKHPPARSYREPIRQLIRKLEFGETLADSLWSVSHWLPSFDTSLLESGEKSGRLDACFKMLAEYYRERATLLRRMLGQLAYPLFLFHFAVLLGPFPQLFLTGNFVAYLQQTLGVFIPVYAAVFLLILACQGRNGEKWRAGVERVMSFIPVVGRARVDLALARLALALEAMINAGSPIIEAWELAGQASGSPRLQRAVSGWRRRVELDGLTPSDAMRESGAFPELFVNLYYSGEVSGSLDETLRRLYEHYREEGSRRMQIVADMLPKLIYFGIMGWIASRILFFYIGYFKNLSNILGN